MFEALTFWHWASIAALLLIFELMIGAEFMLWLAAAAVLSTLVALVAPDLDWKIQLVLYAAFSVAALVAWAKYSRGKKLSSTDQPHLNKRQYQYVGRKFSLDEAIEGGVGRIVVDDATWKVRGEDAVKGTMVKVVDVDGMVLLIEHV